MFASDEFKIWKRDFLDGFDRFRLKEILLERILESQNTHYINAEDAVKAAGIVQIEQKGMLALLDELLNLGEVDGGEEVSGTYEYDGV